MGREACWAIQSMGSQRLTLTELPYDPAIPLLGIYLEKNMVQKDICTPVFTAALLTIAQTWEQPKRPSADGERRCGIYIYVCVCIYMNITQP